MIAKSTLQARMEQIKHKILVLSGKGGVGKSTVSTQLAMVLAAQGHKVGVLDVDICGPSVPLMLGVEDKEIVQCSEGWVPVYADAEQRLSVMSIGFLLKNKTDPVIFRGPKKNAMIKQFLEDVYWGSLDYLVVDCPPGTSDEHLAVLESLRDCQPDGAVLVTTPQGVALDDVRKEINFSRKLGCPVLGLIENMSGFVCPHCSECTPIFMSGGGETLAEEFGIPFLGKIPIEPQLGSCGEQGKMYAEVYPESQVAKALQTIVHGICEQTEANMEVDGE